MKNIYTFCILGVIVLFKQCENPKDSFPVLNGEYLGQTLPEEDPIIFASGIVSTGTANRDIAMMPDGSEIYFSNIIAGYAYSTICYTKLKDGKWTKPEIAPFAKDLRYLFLEPHISPDGKRLLFLSNMPKNDSVETSDQDIWAVDRVGDTWGEIYNIGEPINTDAPEFFPSVTLDGTIYFTRQNPDRSESIYRCKFIDGKYQEAEKLPEQVNSGITQFNAFIAPDESYIIVPVVGRKDSYGGCDYYIVYRNEKDEWSEPINLGEKINNPQGAEWSPYVSPDGKYFFFMASKNNREKIPTSANYDDFINISNNPENGNSSIYWMKTSFIEKLKPDNFR